MKNNRLSFLAVTLLSICLSAPVFAAGEYATVKAGLFLPNGNGNSTGDLKNYDTGGHLELAAGFTPAQYIAVEAATGFYMSSRSYNYMNDATKPTKDSVYGVPLTLSVKGIYSTEKIDLFAGGGVGYYFVILNQKIPSNDVSQHGNALGYHVVGGIDYKYNEQWSWGAEVKWFATKPKFENINAPGQKVEWEMGGTVMNLTAKYHF